MCHPLRGECKQTASANLQRQDGGGHRPGTAPGLSTIPPCPGPGTPACVLPMGTLVSAPWPSWMHLGITPCILPALQGATSRHLRAW